MPLSLEDRLRALANAGELTYLSVVPVAGNGPDGVVFSASWSPASKWGHGTGRDADPVKAILAALDDETIAKLAKKLKLDTTELKAVEQQPLTKAEQERAAGARAPAPAEEVSDDFGQPL